MSLVALVEVLEDAAQQLRVGVDRLVVRCRLPGGESIAGEQAEKCVVVFRVEYLVRQGHFAHVADAVLEGAASEQSTVQVRNEPQHRVFALAAAAGRHGIEEHRGQDAAKVFALLCVRATVPQVQQIGCRATPVGFSQPLLGLKEPNEEHPAHLPGGPRTGVVLTERLDHRVILIMGQQRIDHAVSNGGVLPVELGGYPFDAELMLPCPGYFQQTGAGWDAQPV